jgi:hypothetical protein
LLVTHQIHAKELNEPVVIRSIYEKISDVAQRGIYGEPEVEPDSKPTLTAGTKAASARVERNDAAVLQAALEEWVAATNERTKAFHKADLIEVRALTPETVFVDNGRVAIMRFRK